MRLRGCRETDRQKLNNLISSPLFTSTPALLFALSHPLISSCLSLLSVSCRLSSILKLHLFSIPPACILSHPTTALVFPPSRRRLFLRPVPSLHCLIFTSACTLQTQRLLNTLTGNIEALIVHSTMTRSAN